MAKCEPTPGWEDAGERMARSDLGYVTGALTSNSPIATLSFMPYAALVAYEADRFLTEARGAESRLEGTLAKAARMAGKIFDDRCTAIEEVSHILRDLAAGNEQHFRGGTKRKVARFLGIFNPDLSVFMLDNVPLIYGTVLPFQLGLHTLSSGGLNEWRPALHATAEAMGTFAQTFDLRLGDHRGDTTLGGRLSALDAVSSKYNAAIFGGQAAPHDALLLGLLMNNAAVGARLGVSRCCPSCCSAAIKHTFVAGYHTALSLQLLLEADLLTTTLRDHLSTLVESPQAQFFRSHRSLRNSLVHLGISDRSVGIVAAADPVVALIEADLGEPFAKGASLIEDATAALDAALTAWLLEDADMVLSTLRK